MSPLLVIHKTGSIILMMSIDRQELVEVRTGLMLGD
jgi:hypothetical protein